MSESIQKPKRVYKKKQIEQTNVPIIQDQVPTQKPPRKLREKKIKEVSDDEKEIEKLKEILKSKPELCKELGSVFTEQF